MSATIRVLGRVAYASLYDYFGLYNPKAYVMTWVPRVLLESMFLGLVAQFIGGRELLLFTLIGFAGYRALHTTVSFTANSVTSELWLGTLPLLVGAPTSPVIVLTGRSLAWMLHGLSTGILTLIVAISLGLPLTLLSALGALAALVVIESGAYALAIFVGSVLVRFPAAGLTVGNLVGFTLFAIGGVTTPLETLPQPIQVIALALPLSHGLQALRAIFAGADAGLVLSLLLQELGIAVAYLALALASFGLFLREARLRGTLDYQMSGKRALFASPSRRP